MRESYDCVVVGRGPAAILAASYVAAAGHAVVLAEDSFAPRRAGYFLLPQRQDVLDPLRSIGLSTDVLALIAERELEVERVDDDCCQLPTAARHWLMSSERFAQLCREQGLERGLHIADKPPGVTRVVIDATGRSSADDDFLADAPGNVAITGCYRNVGCQSLSSRAALVFGGQRGGNFWLVPLDEERASLGLVVGRATRELLRSPASVWEDALVGCPPLVERLIDAELVGPLVEHRYAKGHDESLLHPRRVTCRFELPELLVPAPSGQGWPGVAEVLETAAAVVALLRQPVIERTHFV